ncbi:MAG: CPBP family intramembrane metalloprotease [Planctomycetes bacterium]|nr:CPBP family intramembrane metalloprotease [Planctomycetota bacterium]
MKEPWIVRRAGLVALVCLLLGGGLAWLGTETEASQAEEKAAKKERKAEAKDQPWLREQATQLRAEASAIRELSPRIVLGLGPLIGALLFCMSGAARPFRRLGPARIAALGAGLCAFSWLMVATPPPLGLGIDPARAPPWLRWLPPLDIYVLAIVVTISVASVRAGQSLKRPGLSGAALAVWLLLWIPFDLRWLKELWEGPARLSYTGPALWIVFLAVLSEGVAAGRTRALGLRLPLARDLAKLAGLTLLFALVILPAGLGIGFLEWNPRASGAVSVLLNALGIALTVALPEELFFRGILDARLRESLAKPGPSGEFALGVRGRGDWLALVASSLAFGIMHMNNRSDPAEQLQYFLLASVAGAIYALAFRRGGLLAAIALHTLVDVVWQAVF